MDDTYFIDKTKVKRKYIMQYGQIRELSLKEVEFVVGGKYSLTGLGGAVVGGAVVGALAGPGALAGGLLGGIGYLASNIFEYYY